MEAIAEPLAPFRTLRFAGATVLTLISAACLTLSYVDERRFTTVLRIGFGLGFPWVVARLFARRSYWLRLVFSYLAVIGAGVLVVLIWPLLSLFLMDAGFM
jgi:hypothetical protein